MDKRAALKAAAAVVTILLLFGLVYLAFDGRVWAIVVLAVIFVYVIGCGFYDTFKD